MNPNKLQLSVFGLLISIFCATHANGQWAIKELNLAHQYDPTAEINMHGQTIVKPDSLSLYVDLKLYHQRAKLQDYTFDLFLAGSFSEKLNDPIPESEIDSTHIYSSDKSHILKFDLKLKPSNWVIVRVRSKLSGFSFYFSYQISGSNNPDFNIQRNNQHFIKPYLLPGSYSANKDLYGFYYKHNFNNALPPMVTKAALPEKAMTVDSTFFWPAGTSIALEKQGLYFFQEDTTSLIGRGLRVEHKHYPKLATLDQLIKPLVYITTRKEKSQLDKMTKKKEFDKFWLDLTKSSDRARKIIKEFYSRIEAANYLFSSFKEGWKTDRGMIYIIFGPPNELIKTDTDETWVYVSNNRLPQVKFRFIKTDIIFSSSHYTLIRDKKYDDIWFKVIDFWRKSRF